MNDEVRRARQALAASQRALKRGVEAGVPEERVKTLRRIVENNLRRYGEAITDRELHNAR